MAAQQPWSPPLQFDEYRLVRWVGGGAMGEVFLAHDTLLERPVAVKFIGSVKPDATARERFLVEARAAARLQHPNVVTIYRVGEISGRPYIISEFVRGRGLDELEKPVPWERALELGMDLARGLAAAHRRGVLHRDIKPANAIVAEDGHAKLLDFGLAKLSAPAVPETTIDAPIPIPETGPSEPMAETITRRPHVAHDGEALGGSSVWGETLDIVEDETRPDALKTVPIAALGPLLGISSISPASSPKAEGKGEVVGTPYYMAPEVWRGEPATRRSDVYSLGILLYELLTGAPPNKGLSPAAFALAVQEYDVDPIETEAPTVDHAFAALINRCLRRDPEQRFGSGDELLDALEQLSPARLETGGVIPEGNPYRGLESFDAEHRALFFGRSSEIRSIVERLRTERFVLVAGDSGVGKSSVCRAGVLPLATEGILSNERQWTTVTIIPGRRPLAALSAQLARYMETEEEELFRRLSGEHTAVSIDLRKRLENRVGLVLFIDQMEELLTLSEPSQAAAFSELLERLITTSPGIRVLGAIRGDFLTRLASLPGIGDEIGRALYLLRPMTRDGLRDAIVGPARATQFRFENDELVETLIESTARAEGGLPLLQFALAELWEARDNEKKTIPASALDKIGGVEGALARHADGVLAHLIPPQRAVARRILTQLVTAEGTRARRTEAELAVGNPEATKALQALVRGRLLVAREADQGTGYELAHEALVSGWATLRSWLDETVSTRAAKERLSKAAAEWERLGRVKEALWNAAQLAELKKLDHSDSSSIVHAFLAASRMAVRRKAIIIWGVSIILPIIVFGVRSYTKLEGQRAADKRIAFALQTNDVELILARSESAREASLKAIAFQKYDAEGREEGEKSWMVAQKVADNVADLYEKAGRSVESVLGLPGERSPIVRRTFARTLYELALEMDRNHQDRALSQLLERLKLYDDSKEFTRLWENPAQVSVMVKPEPSNVIVHRYVEDENHRLALKRVGPLSGAASLPPGSYVLTAEHAGLVTVRLPIHLVHGDTRRVDLALPPLSKVPRDYVYVPAGAFLFGSKGDPDRRKWLNTAPLREQSTGAFLINRHETTFSEWIEFLDSLPAHEQVRRTPAVAGLHGSLRLFREGGSWHVEFKPNTRLYRARAGELVTYESRDRRGKQNWLRFPVSGVTSEDAEAYTRWLAITGRVPGARLCTELEWERAARGADDREFPHGQELEPDDANFDLTYGKRPDAFGPDEVGSHPTSNSPFGVSDMAGNVWEWTTSVLRPERYALRGGSYYFASSSSQITNRELPEPSVRDLTVGLRVCASVETIN